MNKLKHWNRYIWLIAAWCMLWGYSCPAASAETPMPGTGNWGVAPAYQFHTTSIYRYDAPATFTPIADDNAAKYAPRIGNIRRDGFGDPEDETDLGVGEIANPAPVGSPLALLLFALIYGLYAHFGTQRKPRPEKLKNQEE
ncbi:MAG: hypothetical protein IK073_01650 [Paludibacteraceae bacterium]|nr:hypothetical protein [Paludibacteraceae bacterium]